jgi:hypothetical protein
MDPLDREIKSEDEPSHILYSCLSCKHLNFRTDDDLKNHKLECHGESEFIEDPSEDYGQDWSVNFVDDEGLLTEYEQEDTTVKNPEKFYDPGIILIEKFQLKSAESLRFLIELEEKTIIPAYEKNKTFSGHERGIIVRLIIKNVLKSNVDRL